jgi:hypothetical protein
MYFTATFPDNVNIQSGKIQINLLLSQVMSHAYVNLCVQ